MNLEIRTDLAVSHLETKIKLLETALNKRNSDFDFAEENNR